MKFLVMMLVLLFGVRANAIDLSQNFNFDGYLTDSGGNPITAPTPVKLQIYNPSATCLLFEEVHTISPDTNGGFSVKVGAGTRASSGDDGGKTLKEIFQNNALVRSTGTNCSVSYIPAAGDGRKLRVTVNSTILSPDYNLSPVPMATVAETLQGIPAEGFLKLSSGAPQTITSNVLIDGDFRFGSGSGNYVGIAAYPGTPTYSFTLPSVPPTNGQVMVSNGLGGMNWQAMGGGGTVTSVTGTAPISVATGTTTPLISLNPSGVTAGTYGNANQIPQISVDATGRITTANTVAISGLPANSIANTPAGNMSSTDVQNAINELDSEKVSKAGDTMTGILIVPQLRRTPGVLPGSPVAGEIAIDIGDSYKMKWYDGSSWQSAGGVTSHSMLTSLASDDHTQYAMLAGRAGGQSLIGGTAASNNLTLESTSNATKGIVMIQPNGGNVGIGTIAPSRPLHVQSTSGQAVAFFKRNSGSGGIITMADASSNPTYPPGIGVDMDDFTFFGGGSPTERMRITTMGNIGIGTITPASKLQVKGAVTTTPINNATTTLDWSQSSMITFTGSTCGAGFTFSNMVPGGVYHLIITNILSSENCAFTHPGTTFKYPMGMSYISVGGPSPNALVTITVPSASLAFVQVSTYN